jgi:hypothetical protein
MIDIVGHEVVHGRRHGLVYVLLKITIAPDEYRFLTLVLTLIAAEETGVVEGEV